MYIEHLGLTKDSYHIVHSYTLRTSVQFSLYHMCIVNQLMYEVVTKAKNVN